MDKILKDLMDEFCNENGIDMDKDAVSFNNAMDMIYLKNSIDK